MDYEFEVKAVSETHFMLYFQATPCRALSLFLGAFSSYLREVYGDALFSVVPGFNTLLVGFNAEKLSPVTFKKALESHRVDGSGDASSFKPKKWVVPVYYHPEVAPDLESVAQRAGFSVDEVIGLHIETTYFVYAVGFMPGFAYMGDLDTRLALPRLATPRLSVAKGSVAVAEQQTAVYPFASPGGWHILGRCPKPLLTLCDNGFECMQVGDSVQFQSIDRHEFICLGGELI